MFLAQNPVCCDPFGRHAKVSRIVPAVDVDHIKPRLERPDLAFSPSNLRPLCKSCHGKVTRAAAG